MSFSVRLRQVREMQHGQDWTKMWVQEAKESAVMSHSNLCRWVGLSGHFSLLANYWERHNSLWMMETQRTICLRIPFLLLYAAAVGSSTRSWVPCVKGDPASLHGSLVRPVPQGEDPRDPRVTHGYPQPLTKEGAAPAWNPIQLAHGPGHPHQLSCGWWGGVKLAACVVHITSCCPLWINTGLEVWQRTVGHFFSEIKIRI